jgi:hypothetical protein
MICINGYEFWDMKISIIMALLIVLENQHAQLHNMHVPFTFTCIQKLHR